MATIDTTRMGNETYKLIKSFDEFPSKTPTNYVFTRNPAQTPHYWTFVECKLYDVGLVELHYTKS